MTYAKLRTAMEATSWLIPGTDPEARDVPSSPQRWNVEELAPGSPWRHLRWMVEESLSWGPERAEKLNRWLGFVQGVLWANQVATINELREINQPAPEEPS